MALVSCIIPVHNAKVSYLSATLADLRKQSFQDYEIVIVDDASTDEETIQYLRSLEANPKVKLVWSKVTHAEYPHGAGFPRNVGLKAATGEYVAFIDADDFLHTEYLQVMVDMFRKHPGLEVAVINHARWIEKTNQYDMNAKMLISPGVVNCNTWPNVIEANGSMWARMCLRSFISRPDLLSLEYVTYQEDMCWWMIVCSKASKIIIEQSYIYYYYRIRDEAHIVHSVEKKANSLRTLFHGSKEVWERIKNDNSYISANFKRLYNMAFMFKMRFALTFGLKTEDQLKDLKADIRIKPLLDEIDLYINTFINKK